MLLSLIVPCYNEQDALPIFYRETTKVLAGMDCDCEILLINDGSKDQTLSIMKELAAGDPRVLYFSFSRNFGKEAAMYAGFCNARGDYIAVMDADLQDPPSLLPEMVKVLQSGEYDSVATRRADREGEAACAGMLLTGKHPEMSGKAVTKTVMVETYAVLALLVSFLAVNGIRF